MQDVVVTFSHLDVGRGRAGVLGATGMDDVLDELREIARGLHPAILAHGGQSSAGAICTQWCSIQGRRAD
jgi:hypothetical protein